MQDSFYSGLKTQEIQIINHTIQYLNQDYFLIKAPQPAHPDFLKPVVEHPNIRNSVRCLLINQNQEICLLYSRARDYYAIPGGGIEPTLRSSHYHLFLLCPARQNPSLKLYAR